jgi:hypothetical protein
LRAQKNAEDESYNIVFFI